MKRLFALLIIVLSICAGTIFNGCYSDTIDAFSSFSFQFPVFFGSDYIDRKSPDTTTDFVNLYNYKDYTDNKARINKAEILSFNYRIDSLTFIPPDDSAEQVFDPENPAHLGLIEYDSIKLILIFAKPKDSFIPGLDDVLDPDNYVVDSAFAPQLLGVFKNVKVEDYYRLAHHIELTDKRVAKVIEEALQNRPHFYIISEYSKLTNQTEGKPWKFPFISAKYDMVIRFNVDT
jgi:hypothetical protein